MGKMIAIIIALSLSGCASYQAGKIAIVSKGAELSDEILTTAEWTVCYAASVGSIKRRYGMSVDRANLYREFCYGEGEANIVGPME